MNICQGVFSALAEGTLLFVRGGYSCKVSITVQGQKMCQRNMLHLCGDLKLVAEDSHPIMGHGENASSPTEKVKVSFQPTVQW